MQTSVARPESFPGIPPGDSSGSSGKSSSGGPASESWRTRSLTVRLAPLLDQAFQIPGTQIRFGWDAILGIIPFLGDTAGLSLSVALLFEARVRRVRWRVLAKMAGIILFDAAIGSVPVVGDVFDIWFKSNMRLLRLLERELGQRDDASEPTEQERRH